MIDWLPSIVLLGFGLAAGAFLFFLALSAATFLLFFIAALIAAFLQSNRLGGKR